MQYNRLGRSGLLTSDLTLGTMLFGDTTAKGTPEKDAQRIIDTYLDAGGNHIDTANVYVQGESERILGRALGSRRQQLILATKVNFPMGDGQNQQGLSRYHIMQEVEHCLERLQTDYIDLLYMHCWDEVTPIEESLRAFDDLVTQGKVRYIGVSNFKTWQLMKAVYTSDRHGWNRFVAAQYQYSLVKRDIEYDLAEACREEGLGLTPWGPLGGGFLSGKYKRGEKPTSGRIATHPDHTEEAWERRNTERNWAIIDEVGVIAEERGLSYPQVALAWLRHQPNVSSVIIGTRTLGQLEDNLGAASVALSEEELDRLDQASALPELYPYRMIEAYGRKWRR